MVLTERVIDETVFGSNRDGASTVAVQPGAGSPSGLVLMDTAGVEYVIWVKTDGALYIGTRANFATPNAAGTKVGGQ
jgi:hypothetical protein